MFVVNSYRDGAGVGAIMEVVKKMEVNGAMVGALEAIVEVGDVLEDALQCSVNK